MAKKLPESVCVAMVLWLPGFRCRHGVLCSPAPKVDEAVAACGQIQFGFHALFGQVFFVDVRAVRVDITPNHVLANHWGCKEPASHLTRCVRHRKKVGPTLLWYSVETTYLCGHCKRHLLNFQRHVTVKP